MLIEFQDGEGFTAGGVPHWRTSRKLLRNASADLDRSADTN
ncbi:hypothetical protein BN2537_17077 [Streptomyces venezuelae]|nr:hypothetical protein BN2537_17077 [Streptomyces venezuelae]